MFEYDYRKGPFEPLDIVYATVQEYDPVRDCYVTALVEGRFMGYDAHERMVTIWVSDSETLTVNIENTHYGNEVA